MGDFFYDFFFQKSDLLASGAADQTVKLWRLSSGILLKSLANFSHWIIHLVILDETQHKIERFLGKHVLIAMTKDNLSLFSWSHLDELHAGKWDFQIPLNPTDCFAWKKVFFTPGMQLFGQKIAFVRQVAMFDTHTVGDADLVIANANDGQVINTIHINQKIRKLLAVGERYALVLLPFVNHRYQNLAIVDLKERKIVGGTYVPHSRANNPDFTQITVGSMKWLDGFEMRSSSDFLVALATVEHSLHIVKWNIDGE